MCAHLDKPFSEFHLFISNGTMLTFIDSRVILPNSLVIPFVDDDCSLNVLIESVFSDLIAFGPDSRHMINRTILTTRNDLVHEINDVLIKEFPGAEHRYFSYDEILDITKQENHENFLKLLEPQVYHHMS